MRATSLKTTETFCVLLSPVKQDIIICLLVLATWDLQQIFGGSSGIGNAIDGLTVADPVIYMNPKARVTARY